VTTATGGVLLVDLENMVGQKAKPGIVAARMEALIERGGPGVEVVAACARARITPDGTKVLHDRGVTLLTVDGSKDAADEALLAEAQRLASGGCHRFVVASNDSRFARLADLGDLEILIWAAQKPRKNYTARASRVHRLPIPAVSTAFHSATSATAPVAASPTLSGKTKIQQTVTPKSKAATSANATAAATKSARRQPQRQSSPDQPAFAMTQTGPATAGVGVLVAGMLFGAGAALGDLAVRRLFRYRERIH
jgi:hypothetical protein